MKNYNMSRYRYKFSFRKC